MLNFLIVKKLKIIFKINFLTKWKPKKEATMFWGQLCFSTLVFLVQPSFEGHISFENKHQFFWNFKFWQRHANQMLLVQDLHVVICLKAQICGTKGSENIDWYQQPIYALVLLWERMSASLYVNLRCCLRKLDDNLIIDFFSMETPPHKCTSKVVWCIKSLLR